jgi:hypothetical protein
MMQQRGDLGAWTRAAVQPAVGVDVAHWLEVHAVVERESDSADVIP